MIAKRLADLPEVYTCLLCRRSKPVGEMIVVFRRRTRDFRLKPRCKECHNQRERGHRREWKAAYLRRWRARNSALTESYWKTRNAERQEELRVRAQVRFARFHAAILIQGRLRRRLGEHVSLKEAQRLFKKFGPCYPTRYGLTPGGLREVERIRSMQRRTLPPKRRDRQIEIRLMVYEDGYYIKPSRQIIPYQMAADRLRRFQAEKKERIGNP